MLSFGKLGKYERAWSLAVLVISELYMLREWPVRECGPVRRGEHAPAGLQPGHPLHLLARGSYQMDSTAQYTKAYRVSKKKGD